MLLCPNPAAAPVPLTVADDRFPPQTAAIMKGVAQLLTGGRTRRVPAPRGQPLLRGSRIGLEAPRGCRRCGSSCAAVRAADRAAGPVCVPGEGLLGLAGI
ncbi:hypothetical protein VPH35_085828 [Triticum aestivum]